MFSRIIIKVFSMFELIHQSAGGVSNKAWITVLGIPLVVKLLWYYGL